MLKNLFNLRDKAAQKRGHLHEDEEKPFLEHLEDLRSMFLKMVTVTIISMVVCFIFNKQLLDVARYPVKLAGLAQGDAFELPESIEGSRWREAERIVTAASEGDPALRDAYIAAATKGDQEMAALVDAYTIFQMAATLDQGRESFVARAVQGREGVEAHVRTLLTDNPNADPKGRDSLIKMSVLNPPESFTLSIKLSLYAGIVLCFPFLLYYLAEFVLPGLHAQEKRLLAPSMGIGFGLFLTGVLFSYYVVTPRALEFFNNYGERLGMQNDWRIGYYVGFVTQLTLVFGLCFELPVVVMALVKLELLSFEMMRNTRPYAIVIIFFVSALITPTTDILTLCLLGVPMTILYEMCIWLAFFSNRKQRKLEAKEEAERAERRAALALQVKGTAAKSHHDEDDQDPDDHDDYHDHHDHDDPDHSHHDPDYYPGHHEHYHDDPDPHHDPPVTPKPAPGTVPNVPAQPADPADPADPTDPTDPSDPSDPPAEPDEPDDRGDHHNDPYREDEDRDSRA
ncbi:hypothetical protein BH23VER1_BH23VER1_03880 [soil metagenome]